MADVTMLEIYWLIKPGHQTMQGWHGGAKREVTWYRRGNVCYLRQDSGKKHVEMEP